MPAASISASRITDLADQALLLLRAIAKNPEIRAAMGAGGYSIVHQARGFQLILAANQPTLCPDSEPVLGSTVVELCAWYEYWSEVARARVLRREHLTAMGLGADPSGDFGYDCGFCGFTPVPDTLPSAGMAGRLSELGGADRGDGEQRR